MLDDVKGKSYVERVVSYSGDGLHMFIAERSFIKRSDWNICDTSAGNSSNLERYKTVNFDDMQQARKEWCELHDCEFKPVKDSE